MTHADENNNGKKFPAFLYNGEAVPDKNSTKVTAAFQDIRESLPRLDLPKRKAKCLKILRDWEKTLVIKAGDALREHKGDVALVQELFAQNKLLQAFVFARSFVTRRTGEPYPSIFTPSAMPTTNAQHMFQNVCALLQKSQTAILDATLQRVPPRQPRRAARRARKVTEAQIS